MLPCVRPYPGACWSLRWIAGLSRLVQTLCRCCCGTDQPARAPQQCLSLHPLLVCQGRPGASGSAGSLHQAGTECALCGVHSSACAISCSACSHQRCLAQAAHGRPDNPIKVTPFVKAMGDPVAQALAGSSAPRSAASTPGETFSDPPSEGSADKEQLVTLQACQEPLNPDPPVASAVA